MSISNIEELDWFVQTEIGNIFMNNAGEIVDALYVIKNKKDGAGWGISEKIFMKDTFKFLYI